MATTKAAPGKKGLINFDFLQKLGKVLMTVIAVMPAAGLMISLGKLVQMGGGDIAAVMTIGTTTCTSCSPWPSAAAGQRSAPAVPSRQCWHLPSST